MKNYAKNSGFLKLEKIQNYPLRSNAYRQPPLVARHLPGKNAGPAIP
jgi:hypothetical protein